MRTLGNILWHFPFFGFLNAIIVYIIGLLLTLTVIAAPIGLGLMEYGKFLFAPFSWAMVSKSKMNVEQNKAWQAYSTVVMIIYIPIGLIMCLLAVLQVIGLITSIIGIPVAIVIAKSMGTYLNPVNKKCVHFAVAEAIDKQKADDEVRKHVGEAKSLQ